MKKSVIITGASTGIGLAAAKVLIDKGYHVFGSVRKDADGKRVQGELGSEFTPLLFDVTDQAAIAAAVEQVGEAVGGSGLAGLVNNAGVAPTGPLMHATMDEIRSTFETNVFGLLAVTQAFLPLLGARRDAPYAPGRIVNISSISGGVAFPLMGVYAMSKHAVEALSDALRREMILYGISVSAVEPGSIKTPIWDKVMSPRQIGTRFADTDYATAVAAMPDVIANEMKHAKPMSVVTDAICHALEARKPKTRYPLVGLWYARKIIPDRKLDQIAAKMFRLNRLD
jgi:NAD(P)-dependent dehydrogenase (short-subunit alcohol dehydrogenase family)